VLRSARVRTSVQAAAHKEFPILGLPAASPFLRWAGSKRQHVPMLRRYWHRSFRRYVEPFAGSAALFFAIRPRRAVLGDLNDDLVRTFKVVAADAGAVSNALSRLPVGRANYYIVRALKPEQLDPTERAARFIYLNRFCFNGLFRTNTLGEFNVPYGAPKTTNVPTRDQLIACGALLRRASIKRADFRETLGGVRSGDFVYLDPPYAVSNRRVFVEYGSSIFAEKDLQELGDLLAEIESRGATFLISYADCREARRALGRWPRRRVPVRRNVAGFSGARRTQYELFFSNLTAF
jgi:DNA adenine methylase